MFALGLRRIQPGIRLFGHQRPARCTLSSYYVFLRGLNYEVLAPARVLRLAYEFSRANVGRALVEINSRGPLFPYVYACMYAIIILDICYSLIRHQEYQWATRENQLAIECGSGSAGGGRVFAQLALFAAGLIVYERDMVMRGGRLLCDTHTLFAAIVGVDRMRARVVSGKSVWCIQLRGNYAVFMNVV